MKIKEVKPILSNRFLFVQITTDEGIVGVGESGAWAFQDAAKEAVNTFALYLEGKDPLTIEHHWQYMYRSFHFRGAAIMGAISAIDIALWDIAGKYYGCPVYQLLGGKVRDKARVYYHVGGGDLDSMVTNLKEAKAKGFTAVGHLSPFLDEPRTQVFQEVSFAKKIEKAIQRVGAYREAVGNDVDLCVEIHRQLNIPEAIAFAHGIEEFHPFFLEDPTTPDNFDSMIEIASRVNIPVATGERYHTPQEFAMLLKRDGAQYVRPDICLCGGITGGKKIAALAEANGVMVVPHNPLSPISTAACIQIAAIAPNFALQEFPGDDRPSTTDHFSTIVNKNKDDFRQGDVVKETISYADGYLQIPTKPGIGVELVDDVETRFPYKRRGVLTRVGVDGAVVDQ